jgi:hypothetical protein
VFGKFSRLYNTRFFRAAQHCAGCEARRLIGNAATEAPSLENSQEGVRPKRAREKLPYTIIFYTSF